MTRPIFLFIASIFLLLPVIVATGGISIELQLLICMPFILLLGIPHGAIDNVLYMNEKELSVQKFVSIYLLFIGLNVLLWLIFPIVGYLSFLILSAYHFGQSQFSHYLKNKSLLNKALFISWGITLLASLIFFNLEEIQGIMLAHPEFTLFEKIHEQELLKFVFFGSIGTSFILLAYMAIKKHLSLEIVLMEVMILTLILVCFFLMPLLISFTLYFVILHSVKVLREEFLFLKMKNAELSVLGFIKMVAPFTLISLFGMAFLFILVELGIIKFSYGYVFLISISSITLPHAYVMNKFYNLLSQKGINRQLTT